MTGRRGRAECRSGHGVVWAGGAVVLASLLAACSLFTSFDNLVPAGNGGDEAGLPEGSLPDGSILDGAAVDGTPDGTRDGAPGDVAVTDVPADRDGATPASCDAGFLSCADGCRDPQSDPHDCGRCGHDCQGGACQTGVCQPVNIATGQQHPTPILAVGSTLYWGNFDCCTNDAVMKCPLPDCGGDGGAAVMVFAAGQNQVSALTADGTNLYWLGHDFVAACPLGACTTPSLVAKGGTQAAVPGQLAVGSVAVYWASQDNGGIIEACTLAGCGVPAQFQGGCCHNTSGVVSVNGMVYWNDSKGAGRGVLECAAGASCTAPVAFASVGGQVNFFATADGELYWTMLNPDSVMSCPVTGCTTPAVVAAGQSQPTNIAADSSGVYWTNEGNHTLMGCPTGCTTPTQLATTSPPTGGITTDAMAVYWTESNGGLVRKVAKP